MSSVQVRPFRRDDHDQLARLVNAHAEAVVPGMSPSVNAVLSRSDASPGVHQDCIVETSAFRPGRKRRPTSLECQCDMIPSSCITLVAGQQNRIAPPRTRSSGISLMSGSCGS